MRVLILTTCYPRRTRPNHGIFAHRQVRALSDLGVECHVLQPVEWSPPRPLHKLHAGWQAARRAADDLLDEIDGVPIHHPTVCLPKPSRFFPGDYWERVGRSVARYLANRRELSANSILYAHFLCHEGYAGLIAAETLGIPLAAIALGDDVHAWPERWPDRRAKLAKVLGRADGLLACSQALARDAERWATDGLATRIEVVYIGIDTDNFAPPLGEEGKRIARGEMNLPKDRRILLCVGTPIPQKGWLDLLDAFADLKEVAADWDLAMAGEPRGSDDLDLIAEAGARGLGHRAYWLGCLPPASMPGLYRASDAFVLASHNEGLSNSVMEAMAAGLPVVATDVGGHSEVISNGVDGWLVPPKDRRRLREALREALTLTEESRLRGGAARRRIIGVGDHRANAKGLVRYFDRLLQRGGKGAASGNSECG
jgi:glycosyltransferase involved in cell wall biosynthesis